MAAMVVRGNAKAARLTGLASLRAKASGVARRATACAAAAVMVGAVGAALVQLVAQLLSISVPVAVTGITVMAAAVVNSLRRHLRTGRVTNMARGTRIVSSGKPARTLSRTCPARRPAGLKSGTRAISPVHRGYRADDRHPL